VLWTSLDISDNVVKFADSTTLFPKLTGARQIAISIRSIGLFRDFVRVKSLPSGNSNAFVYGSVQRTDPYSQNFGGFVKDFVFGIAHNSLSALGFFLSYQESIQIECETSV
jgi:hypothetical protein